LKIEVLPGWWFDLACTLVAALVLTAVVRSGAGLPKVLPLVLFSLLMLAAENSFILYPSSASVSTSFMVVIAAIAAFDRHGAVLGACIVGSAGGLVVELFKKRRYTFVLFGCAQYMLASLSAALMYQWLWDLGRPAAFAGAVAAFAAVNVGLVLPVVALNYRQRPRDVWADMRPALPNYFGFGLLGVVVGTFYSRLGPVSLPLLIIPSVIARKAFASFMELRAAHDATVRVFIRAIEAKDRYTAGHTERVAKYAMYIGEELRLSQARLEHLRYAALLHDVGKLAVPRHILNKPGRLTEAEYAIVQRHNQVCEDILTRVDFMSSMVGTASDRHAHYDRAGRERGRLVQEAHIVAVADAFDAMTSTRAYRRALTQEVAFAELRDKAGTQFNPECVEALIRTISRRGERYGLGYEKSAVEFDVPPPIAGVGSAGLGDLLDSEKIT
jgi:hypothetical protein